MHELRVTDFCVNVTNPVFLLGSDIQTWDVAVKAVRRAELPTMAGGSRYHLVGLSWFTMDYGYALLLAVGNQRFIFFITDVSRPLKQSGPDSSFDSGLWTGEKKNKTGRGSERISQKLRGRSSLDRHL